MPEAPEHFSETAAFSGWPFWTYTLAWSVQRFSLSGWSWIQFIEQASAWS